MAIDQALHVTQLSKLSSPCKVACRGQHTHEQVFLLWHADFKLHCPTVCVIDCIRYPLHLFMLASTISLMKCGKACPPWAPDTSTHLEDFPGCIATGSDLLTSTSCHSQLSCVFMKDVIMGMSPSLECPMSKVG